MTVSVNVDVGHWWNAYAEQVEAVAGRVDRATDDELRRAWVGR